MIDFLACRYCDVKFKVSDIRTNNILKAFEDIAKKERIKDEYLKNVRKHVYGARPEKCVSCGSKKIREDAYGDYSWECLDCEETFSWRLFKVVYSGDIEVYATDRNMAKEKAYDYMDQADIEAEISWECD